MKEVLKPQQAAMLDILEGLFTMRTGKSLPQLLNLVGGEFAAISQGFAVDPAADPYAVTLSDSPAVLRLIRQHLATFIRSEEEIGEATLLKIGPATAQAENGTSPPALFHLAVAPGMMFSAANEELVRRALERRQTAAASEAATLTAHPDFARVRSLCARAGSTFSFADQRGADWLAAISQLRETLEREWEQEDQRLREAEAAADVEEPPTSAILTGRFEAKRCRAEHRARRHRILALFHKLAESGLTSRNTFGLQRLLEEAGRIFL